jgi:hypothetical protein
MIEVAVVLALEGADPEEHFVFLAPFSERRDGPETLADYLNSSRRFLPMMVGGVPKMINRDRILWVQYEKLPSIVELESTVVERLTIIELTDGSRIEGMIPIEDRPREYSRISDVLNDAHESFVRIDEGDDTYFVNKAFIRSVIPR